MTRDARHRARVNEEFTRQAQPFANAAVLRAHELTEGIVEALGAHASGRVLDLASGPGVVTEALARRAREVVALDLTAATLDVARTRCGEAGHTNVRWVRGDATLAPLREASFDGIAIRLALHHLTRPGEALATAFALLRPGGRLVVLDLLSPEDASQTALHTALERLRDPSHAETLSGPALERLALDQGFVAASLRTWSSVRDFDEWAAIIADPVRMGALETVMRTLARRGEQAGIGLREEEGALRFDYRFGLLVAERPAAAAP